MNKTRKRLLITVSALILLVSALALTAAYSKKEIAAAPQTADKHESATEHRPGAIVLSPDAVKTAGIATERITAASLEEQFGATAVLELNGDRISRINPRIAGRCITINASLGDRVRPGQVLVHMDSVEADLAWSDYLKAKARLELAIGNMKREERLFEKKVSPEKDLLKARQELGEAEADMLLAKEKFRRFGIDVSRIEADTNGTKSDRRLIPIPSPLSGTVIDKSVTQGEMIGPEKTIFTVADLSSLWLMIDIYERDIGRIKTGMPVKLSISSYPGREFRGRISYLGDVVDEKSRTVKARVTIDNEGGLLKPGMFATASISSGNAARKAIIIPEEAIFLDGTQRYVFLRQGEGRFIAREILPGSAAGNKIEIKDGLKPGDEVVIKGTFALKSELKKTMLDAD